MEKRVNSYIVSKGEYEEIILAKYHGLCILNETESKNQKSGINIRKLLIVQLDMVIRKLKNGEGEIRTHGMR